jgi:hypothetical protein
MQLKNTTDEPKINNILKNYFIRDKMYGKITHVLHISSHFKKGEVLW